MASKTANKPPAPPVRPFKYGRNFASIAGCPFEAQVSFGAASYRIVHADLKHRGNFLPVAVIYPGRFAGDSDRCQCVSWALSMFEARDQLKKHLLFMQKRNPLWHKIAGDHGVELKVSASHGRRTAASGRGHFSFFEFADFDGTSVVEAHFPLLP
jgi:hypothetical protein